MHFLVQASEILIQVRVEPQFFSQRFGVQRPTLAICTIPPEPPEFWKLFIFLLDRNLVMMPGNSFVQKEAFHAYNIEFCRIGNRYIKNSGPRTIGCRLIVFCTCRSFTKLLGLPHFK